MPANTRALLGASVKWVSPIERSVLVFAQRATPQTDWEPSLRAPQSLPRLGNDSIIWQHPRNGLPHKNPPLGAAPPIMPQISRIAIGLAGAIVGCLCGLPVFASEDFAFYHENVLGTSLALHVRCDNEQAARQTEACVLAEIDRLAAIFSGYDPGSEFSRWQAAPKRPMPVSAALYEVLQLSEYVESQQRRRIRPPGRSVFAALEASVPSVDGYRQRRRRSLRRSSLNARVATGAHNATAERLSDCPLSLNGIAKGYIVDQACERRLERRQGVRGLLLNVGGDLRVRGEIGQHDRHRRPVGRLRVVRTLRQYRGERPLGRHQRQVPTRVQINDKWYSHVFDPRTALPVERVTSATVVADEGPTPTPSPRSAASSSPKKASGWSIRCRASNA